MSNRTGSFVDDIERTLFENREIHVVGPIDASQMYVFVKSLRHAALNAKKTANSKPIRVYLHTPGGGILDGLAMYDHIRMVTQHTPVEVIANGACMSMGVVVLQAGTRRLAMPHTRFLLHELQTATGGALADIKDRVSEAERLQHVLDEILSSRTGQNLAKLRKLFERRDYFLDAKEALKFNLIDGVVETEAGHATRA